jgi:hypothetical protein
VFVRPAAAVVISLVVVGVEAKLKVESVKTEFVSGFVARQ